MLASQEWWLLSVGRLTQKDHNKLKTSRAIQFYSVVSSNKKSCCFNYKSNILQEKITYLNISVKSSVTIFLSCIFFLMVLCFFS